VKLVHLVGFIVNKRVCLLFWRMSDRRRLQTYLSKIQ